MKRENKLQHIPFAHTHLLSWNDREHTHERLLNAGFLATAGVVGQKMPVTFHRHTLAEGESYPDCVPDKEGFVYGMVCGNSRFYTARYMGQQGVVDPKTMKRDDKGQPIIGTGKPFSSLEGWVITEASKEELRDIMQADNAGVKINRLEVCRALMRVMLDERTEYATMFVMYEQLLQAYPPQGEQLVKLNKFIANLPSEASEAKRQELIREFHIGAPGKTGRLHNEYVTIKAAYTGPTVLKEAYEQRLRGKQSWPTDAEVRNGTKLYNQDVEDRDPISSEPARFPDGGTNRAGLISPDNVGPRFTEFWDEVLGAVKTAEVEGTRKKSAVMLTNAQIKERLNTSKSLGVNLVLLFVLNKIKGSVFDDFLTLHTKFENGKMPQAEYYVELKKFYDKTVTEAKAEEQTESDSAAA